VSGYASIDSSCKDALKTRTLVTVGLLLSLHSFAGVTEARQQMVTGGVRPFRAVSQLDSTSSKVLFSTGDAISQHAAERTQKHDVRFYCVAARLDQEVQFGRTLRAAV
jgi:hypothetical protein